VQRLSLKLKLACGERSFDELHLQQRMDRARWWHLYSVRGREVQGVNRMLLELEHLHKIPRPRRSKTLVFILVDA
jgi:hypothetical protein